MSDFVPAAQITEAKQALDRLRNNMRVTIRGKDDVIEQVLICLVAGGHLLIEDLPGVGKTTLAQVLARTLGLDFHRIQFTSDMLPADIIGVSVYPGHTALPRIPSPPSAAASARTIPMTPAFAAAYPGVTE